MKLNVRYKFETLNTQHGATPYSTRVWTHSQQTNHEPQRQNPKQQANKPGGLKTGSGCDMGVFFDARVAAVSLLTWN